ncbi:MAG: hypothetical protein ABIJ00_04715 [Candidatus Eisenbacteria bacterium]
MRINRRIHFVWTGIALLCAVRLAGCGGLETQSVWRSREIVIDGSPADWEGISPTYVEAPNIAIRAVNDDHYLYLLLSSPDRNLAAQMLTRGFTVWFDPKGREDEALGIHYPLGTDSPLMAREALGDRTEIRQTIINMFESAGEVMEVLRSDEDEPVVLPIAGQGIEVRPGYASRNFVYEMRVPLQRGEDQPYAIGSKPGRQISVGLETPEVDPEEIREAIGRDIPSDGEPMDGDGTGGMEGDRGRGMTPGPGIRGPHDLEGLDIWARLILATAAISDEKQRH